MHVSRSTKPFTNHSWQVWRSIYTKEQGISTKVQGKTSFETKLNNVTQTFDFLLFMWFLDFWHIRMKRLIKSNNVKTAKTDEAINNQ